MRYVGASWDKSRFGTARSRWDLEASRLLLTCDIVRSMQPLSYKAFTDEIEKLANRRAIQFALQALSKKSPGITKAWHTAKKTGQQFPDFLGFGERDGVRLSDRVYYGRLGLDRRVSRNIKLDEATNSPPKSREAARRTGAKRIRRYRTPPPLMERLKVRGFGPWKKPPWQIRQETRKLDPHGYAEQKRSASLRNELQGVNEFRDHLRSLKVSGRHKAKPNEIFLPHKGGYRQRGPVDVDLSPLKAGRKSGLMFKGGPTPAKNSRNVFVSRHPDVAAGYSLGKKQLPGAQKYDFTKQHSPLSAYRTKGLRRRGESSHLATTNRSEFMKKQPDLTKARRGEKVDLHSYGRNPVGKRPDYEDVVDMKNPDKSLAAQYQPYEARKGGVGGVALRRVKGPSSKRLMEYVRGTR